MLIGKNIARSTLTLISADNFTQAQKTYFRANPDAWVMIRPDRPFDQPKHRYPDDDARNRGDKAMYVWFEYLAAKKFHKTFNTWRHILTNGKSIMVVCDDPYSFDPAFTIPAFSTLPFDFWRLWNAARAGTMVVDEFTRAKVIVGLQSLGGEIGNSNQMFKRDHRSKTGAVGEPPIDAMEAMRQKYFEGRPALSAEALAILQRRLGKVEDAAE
jgi:hypothetical protein